MRRSEASSDVHSRERKPGPTRNLGGASIKALLTLPAMLTLGVAMRKPDFSSQYQFNPTDPAMSARYGNFVIPMRMADAVTEDQVRVTPEKTRECVQFWIDQYRAGKLKPLAPVGTAETIFDGPSGQIVRAESSLCTLMDSLVEADAKAKQYDLAASDAMKLVEMTQILRYSDLTFDSLLDSRLERTLSRLREVAPRVSEEKKKEIAKNLPNFRLDGEQYADLAHDSFAAYLRSDLANADLSPAGDKLPNLDPIRKLGPDSKASVVLSKVRASMHKGGNASSNYPFETILSRSLFHRTLAEQQLDAAVKDFQN